MRTSISRWTLTGATIISLAVISAAGCKTGGFSLPRPSWMSWGKKDPPTSALAATKPSSVQLPSNTASPYTASTSSAPRSSFGGKPSYMASATSPATYGSRPSGASPAADYYTGPYNTGAASTAQTSPASPANAQQGYYSSTSPQNASSPSASGYGASPTSVYDADRYAAGYDRSGSSSLGSTTQPYGYRTADSRASSQATTPYGQGAYNPTATNPYGGAGGYDAGAAQQPGYNPPAAYGVSPGVSSSPTNSGYGAATGASSPYATRSSSGEAAIGYGPSSAAYGAPQSGYAAQPSTATNPTNLTSGGTYRPGSTGRNTSYEFGQDVQQATYSGGGQSAATASRPDTQRSSGGYYGGAYSTGESTPSTMTPPNDSSYPGTVWR